MNILNNLSAIRIVLVNTTHPGNIGATARAMKNMGLTQLYLVNPKIFPHVDATARASGADDLLATAQVVTTLDEAVADCKLIIGTSARSRGIPWPLLNVREAAEKMRQEAVKNKIAIVFGQEQFGLTNEELECCHFVITIPCNPDYASLNLAAAVQIIAYEIRMAFGGDKLAMPLAEPGVYDLATAEEMQKFYEHLQQTLIELEFLDPKNPRKLMRRLIRLFNRARVEKREINILRGILTAMEKVD